MARVVVDVMLKPEILDPQGKAVAQALPRLGLRRHRRRPAGQALRARGRRRGDRGAAGPDPRRRRDPALQPGDRGLHRPGRGRREPGCGSGSSPSRARWTTATRRARCGSPAARRSRSGTRDADLHGVDAVVLPGGFSYGDYLRCGAIARFAPVMEPLVDGGPRRPAGARHLQRLPGAVRVAPAARRADPQRPPQVRLPRPGAARSRTPSTAWTSAYDSGPGDRRTAEERRGRLRRRRRRRSTGSRARAGSSRATSATTPTGPTATSPASQRARQRRRPDAAPRARGRGR